MLPKNGVFYPLESCSNRLHLLQDLDAVALFLDHSRSASDFPFDLIESLDYDAFLQCHSVRLFYTLKQVKLLR
jgi:hypothetical protein